jgi:hypothetical protein
MGEALVADPTRATANFPALPTKPGRRLVSPGSWTSQNVADGYLGPVELGGGDAERLVVGHGAVLQDAQRNLLA